MPEKEAKNKLVRGADGSLFIVSEDQPPRKLEKAEADTVKKILADAGKQVTKRLIGVEATRGSSVNVQVQFLAELPS